MIKYYVTFLGNDTFQSSEKIEGKDFAAAFQRANELLPAIERHTIEQVRIGSIEEYEHFALDRALG
jgi:hypothetical protein